MKFTQFVLFFKFIVSSSYVLGKEKIYFKWNMPVFLQLFLYSSCDQRQRPVTNNSILGKTHL